MFLTLFQISTLKKQVGTLDKAIDGSGLKNLSSDLQSKMSTLEKHMQEKKDDLDAVKRSSDELGKNFETLKNKFEMETLKQIEIFEEKLALVDKNVKNQIPKEIARIDTAQKLISDQSDTIRQQVEAANSRLAQNVSKSDLQARIENLETRIQMKVDASLQKNTDAQEPILWKPFLFSPTYTTYAPSLHHIFKNMRPKNLGEA